MKKIDEVSINEMANESVVIQKRMKFTKYFVMRFLVGGLVVVSIVSGIFNPIGAVGSFLSAGFLYVVCRAVIEQSKKTINSICNILIRRAHDYQDVQQTGNYGMTIDIVPRNIKVGDSLETANPIPIFKEGKYIIVKSLMSPLFIKVVPNEQDYEEAFVMEPTLEDIYALEKDLPEYDEYIMMLRLQCDK